MAQKYTDKSRTYLNTEGAAIDAYYGPWNSISEFELWAQDEVGLDGIPNGVTIALIDSGSNITKYTRSANSWVQDGSNKEETDPVYTAEKSTLALKNDLNDVESRVKEIEDSFDETVVDGSISAETIVSMQTRLNSLFYECTQEEYNDLSDANNIDKEVLYLIVDITKVDNDSIKSLYNEGYKTKKEVNDYANYLILNGAYDSNVDFLNDGTIDVYDLVELNDILSNANVLGENRDLKYYFNI